LALKLFPALLHLFEPFFLFGKLFSDSFESCLFFAMRALIKDLLDLLTLIHITLELA
jgi:hypothetical protein